MACWTARPAKTGRGKEVALSIIAAHSDAVLHEVRLPKRSDHTVPQLLNYVGLFLVRDMHSAAAVSVEAPGLL
jgi:hypothetical protein